MKLIKVVQFGLRHVYSIFLIVGILYPTNAFGDQIDESKGIAENDVLFRGRQSLQISSESGDRSETIQEVYPIEDLFAEGISEKQMLQNSQIKEFFSSLAGSLLCFNWSLANTVLSSGLAYCCPSSVVATSLKPIHAVQMAIGQGQVNILSMYHGTASNSTGFPAFFPSLSSFSSLHLDSSVRPLMCLLVQEMIFGSPKDALMRRFCLHGNIAYLSSAALQMYGCTHNSTSATVTDYVFGITNIFSSFLHPAYAIASNIAILVVEYLNLKKKLPCRNPLVSSSSHCQVEKSMKVNSTLGKEEEMRRSQYHSDAPHESVETAVAIYSENTFVSDREKSSSQPNTKQDREVEALFNVISQDEMPTPASVGKIQLDFEMPNTGGESMFSVTEANPALVKSLSVETTSQNDLSKQDSSAEESNSI